MNLNWGGIERRNGKRGGTKWGRVIFLVFSYSLGFKWKKPQRTGEVGKKKG